MHADVWPYARQRMTRADAEEIARTEPRGGRVTIGYDGRRRCYFARVTAVGGPEARHPTDPMAAFRDLVALLDAPEIVRLLG